MRKSYRAVFILSLGIGGLLLLYSPGSIQERAQAGSLPLSAAGALPGQSVTLLPSGHHLLLGGEGSEGPVIDAAIWEPHSNVTTVLENGLQNPRAWHTATLLPNGTVFILGGIGTDGQVVDVAELFHPETGEFEAIPSIPLAPRAHHTATLLTDGRLLVVGGFLSGTGTTSLAELWDFRANSAETLPVSLLTARQGHTASLLPDGNVLFWGGVDKFGAPLDYGEVFDPLAGQFRIETRLPTAKADRIPPRLEFSIPDDGAVDVPLDVLIALRFSKPLQVESITSSTVVLESAQGVVGAKVVPAEGGMLAFITPAAPLLPGTTYTLTIEGPVDQNNRSIVPSTISFTTVGVLAGASDDEEWIPSAEDFQGKWRTNRPNSPWQELPPLQAAPGVTALAGQVLKLNGKPLKNVTLEIHGGYKTQTDETGRFLLESIPVGHHSLWIKGHTANSPGKTYGIFAPGVDITGGITNVLSYTIWMPRIDTAHAVKIPSPTESETVITTPRLPGLELRLPANTVIRDHHGNVSTEISITAIPLDRTPFPLPRGVDVPIYFTIQPGGAYIHAYSGGEKKGARLIYPNLDKQDPGESFDFWNYDPYERGWYVYGRGKVSADGRQIVPNSGVEIYEFSGAMVGSPTLGPATGPEPGDEDDDGDPVDLSTGLFVYSKTDLFLPDVIPIQFTRTYRPGDSRSRPFGIGMTHKYEIFPVGDVWPYTFMDIILPDGGRIFSNRTSSGIGFIDAVYGHETTPTIFKGSVTSWNGSGWNLTLKDGTVYVFPDSFEVTNPAKAAIVSIRDRYGNTTSLTRDGEGNLKKITSPNGFWIEFTYDSSNRITQARDNMGRIVTYEYDGPGRLWKVTNPGGGVTEYTYDTSDRMLTIKDPRGIVYLTNEYDSEDRVTKQTLANNGTYLFDYTVDAGGKIIQTDVTDPRGIVKSTTFSSNGYTLSETFALGTPEEQTFSFERDPSTNELLTVTDPVGRKSTYTYDALGNVTSITRLAETPDAVTTAYTYDPTFNQVVTITDPLAHTTAFEYDTSGRLITIKDALNNEISYSYDTAGRVTSMTDPLNNTTQFSYTLGDLSTITDPLGRITARFVNDAGRITFVTDSQGHITRFEFDPLNQLTKVVGPHGGETSFTHDANGNLLSATDARGHATTYSYDNLDRVISRTDPLLNTESYEYDANSNLVKHTDRRGKVTTFEYDSLNRLTFVGFGTTAGPTYESTTSYTYDAVGRLTQIVDSISGTITRTFDDLDLLTSEIAPQGTVGYTYDADKRRTSMTVSGQAATSYTYDEASRLIQITRGTSTVSFAYDAAARRTTMTLPNGIALNYTYDSASQLTGLIYTLGSTTLGNLTYTYDSLGRRTEIGGSFARTALPTAVATASHNAANQLTQWDTATLSYDANGNLANDGTNTYIWDARNRLTSIAGGVTASFQYDALDRRILKDIDGATSAFLYDGMNPVQEDFGAGVKADLLSGLGVDEFLTRTDQLGETTLVPDALGSTVALSNSSGGIFTEHTYEPFGKSTFAGPTSIPYQFSGRENDSTGLYNFRARYYSTALQRFISQDPLGPRGGGNVYAYGQNNPANQTDRLGLWTPAAHDALIRHALAPCGVSNDIIAQIQAASRDWDDLSQDPMLSNYHSMARPGQTAEDAITSRNDLMAMRLWYSQSQLQRGYQDSALYEFAVAIHIIMDFTSPSHTSPNGDPYTWCGMLGCIWAPLPQGTHGWNERLAVLENSPQVYDLNDQAIRSAYEFMTGKSLSCKKQ